MPDVLAIAPRLFVRHYHGSFRYSPSYYPWIVGYVFVLSAIPALVAIYGAYHKPEADRRLDRYLTRNLGLEDSHVSTLDERGRYTVDKS